MPLKEENNAYICSPKTKATSYKTADLTGNVALNSYFKMDLIKIVEQSFNNEKAAEYADVWRQAGAHEGAEGTRKRQTQKALS